MRSGIREGSWTLRRWTN
uniref:Uncharacterized protein n=1 Tax=Anguilla anguilla TaxID=7936 RepID=A0A0E9S9H1_ANGAN